MTNSFLLDTCTFIWLAWDSPMLSEPARTNFRDPSVEVFLSAASTWEIAMKHRLGRLPLPQDPKILVPHLRKQHKIATLVIDDESALHAGSLPDLHADPFDRILVAQAVIHGLTVLTPDEEISQYAVKTVW